MDSNVVYAEIDANRSKSIQRLRELIKVYPEGEEHLQDKIGAF